MLAGPGVVNVTPSEMQARAIGFKKIKIGVKYETNFGEELWLIGGHEELGNWDPGNDHGRGGFQAKWHEGHIWYAELDYEMMRKVGRVEFKFVIK